MEILNIVQAAEDVTISAVSAQSTAAPASTMFARLCPTTDIRYRIGANPTALTTDTLLPAGTPEFIPMAAGLKIAAIQESAGGKLNVTFMAG